MKISCTCGSLIIDQSDYLSDKAHFISDQDGFDMRDAVADEIEKLAAAIAESVFDEAETQAAVARAKNAVFDHIRDYTRRNIYQCSECGMLLVDDENYYCQPFAPVDGETAPRNMLRSVAGENWKRPLRARWSSETYGGSKNGSLSWGFGVEDQGFEQFDDYETLEVRYFEVFRRLLENDVLRDAYFSKDAETVHIWNPNAADGSA